jgi:hypothetical protein
MSCDAGCIGISLSPLVSEMPDMSVLTASRRTVLIPILLLSFVARVVPVPLLCLFFIAACPGFACPNHGDGVASGCVIRAALEWVVT